MDTAQLRNFRSRADWLTEGPLGDSEKRLNFALTAGHLGYWELDLRTRKLFCSDIYKANWGRNPGDDFTYDTLLASIHPADHDEHQRKVAEAVESGGTLDVEYRAVWPDRSVRWLRVRGHAVYDKRGKPLRMAGISLDITDRKQSEQALRDETHTLETLNRVGMALAGNLDLERVVQTVTDAATELAGARFGAFFYNVVDDKGGCYMLYTLSGAPREAFEKFPMPRNTAVFGPTFSGSGIVRSDDIHKDPRYGKNAPHFGMPQGHLPVVSYLAVPVISRSGDVLGGLFFGHERAGVFTERAERIVASIAAQAAIAIDNARLFQAAEDEIKERTRAEAQARLLLAELNHRVKNTLAIVQSIAGQTLRHATSAESFRSSFEARLMALSNAHNLLTESSWEGASVRDILQSVLLPYVEEGLRPFTIDGCDIMVVPQIAVSLVLAFHELATNAAKYGALSRQGGHVRITCSDGSAPNTVRVQWQESGGPPVKPPTSKGFGSRLIQGFGHDTNGEVRLDYAPAGLTCSFEIPRAEAPK